MNQFTSYTLILIVDSQPEFAHTVDFHDIQIPL